MTQNTAAFIAAPVGIDVFFQYNLVAGEGTGFVGTENVHGPEVLNGIQVFYDGFFLGHGYGSFGKVGRHNHRKHFRREAHGYRYGKDKSFQPVAFGHSVDQKHEGNHDEHEAYEQEADFADSFVESGGGTVSGNAAGDGAQVSVVSGGNDNAGGRTADYVGAHETDVFQFYDTAFAVFVRICFRALFNRVRFSCQG